MSRGIGFILGGLSCVFGGYRIWKTGWDFRDNVSVPRFAGIPVAIFGVMMIYLGIKKIMNRRKDPDAYLICAKCQNMVQVHQAPDGKCPKCGADLEILEGFYKRHPELTLNTEMHKHQNKD